MLEKLRIQNFKSWQDTGDIAFGSLTGFFGTNSSGKSSILQFLLMLKQTVESSDRSLVLNLGESTSYVELGTLPDVLHGHKTPESLSFSIQWNSFYPLMRDDLVGKDENNFTNSLTFSSAIRQTKTEIYLVNFLYNIDEVSIGIKVNPTPRGAVQNYSLTAKNLPKFRVANAGEKLYRLNKFYGFPNDLYALNDDGVDILHQLSFDFEQLFTNTFYLGPLREYPSRLYIWAGEKPSSVGNRGENAVAALLASRQKHPGIDMGKGQTRRTVEEHVAYWLEKLGLIYSFKVQPIAPNRKEYEVRIQRTAESASVFLTDVGFGVSQILPVLVLLFYVPEGSTVILEQPEIHLHPAVQAGLADVFIDAIKRRKLQIVLESHSEHLLQRLQRRMAEEVITPEAIKLYFTSIQQGRSELTTLDLDEYGNIRNWPEGFFGDTLGEAAAMMEAEMKRRMREQQA